MDIDRSRTVWWGVGGVLAFALLLFVYSFVGTLVFGLFIYYATRSIYQRVRRWIHQPSLAAGLSLTLFTLPGVFLLAYTVLVALKELERFSERANLGQYEAAISPYLDLTDLVSDPAAILEDPSVVQTLGSSFEQALNYAGVIGTGLLHLFVMVALAFYLLRDGPKLMRWVKNQFGDDRNVLVSYLNAVDTDLHRIFFGNIVNAFATGVLGALAYNVLNVFAPPGIALPYPTLVGLLAGLASLVPVIGMKLVYVPVAAYLGGVAFLSGSRPALGFVGLFVVISFVLVDTIPDLVLRPFVAGRGFSLRGTSGPRTLHVGALMFAYILGPLLFGWYGIFLGPVVLVLVIHFARLILPELIEGRPIQPFAVDPSHLVEPTIPDAPPDDASDDASAAPSADAPPDSATDVSPGGTDSPASDPAPE